MLQTHQKDEVFNAIENKHAKEKSKERKVEEAKVFFEKIKINPKKRKFQEFNSCKTGICLKFLKVPLLKNLSV